MSLIRCYSCRKVFLWLEYDKKLAAGKTPKEAMDELGYTRYCCRAHLVCNPRLEDRMLAADTQMHEALDGMNKRITFVEPVTGKGRFYNAR